MRPQLRSTFAVVPFALRHKNAAHLVPFSQSDLA